MRYKIYTQIIISIIVFLIIISFFILNIYKIIENNGTKTLTLKQKEEKEKKDLYFLIYDFISILFIILVIIFTSYQGYTKGMMYALFIWAFFVISTPIPESGLLITLPLKRFFNLQMVYVQFFVSIFALIIIFYLNWVCYKELKTTLIGQVFNLILENKNYGVFILSILSSLLGTQIIEDFINKILMDKKILYLNQKLFGLSLCIVIYFILINGSFQKIQ